MGVTNFYEKICVQELYLNRTAVKKHFVESSVFVFRQVYFFPG